MTGALRARVATWLARDCRPEVIAFARQLAEEAGADAVLFYGSNLRTGSLDGVLDFYILMPGRQIERIWPRVSYRELDYEGTRLRAKIATMSSNQFARAAEGESRDTTIWTRFVQPSALVWARNEAVRQAIIDAIAVAATTASRFAAALGPDGGTAEDYWRALFRATYRAEFRVEKGGREDSILSANRDHFNGLLPDAWQADGLAFDQNADMLEPHFPPGKRREILKRWAARERFGKPLNLVRLAKATTTFDGAARYGAWKLHRHTGIELEVTPFREKHPLLAMPGAAWELWRLRRKRSRNQR